MSKSSNAALIVAVLALVVGGVGLFSPQDKLPERIVERVTEKEVGAFPGPEIYQDLTVYGYVASQEKTTPKALTSTTSTWTITANESGTTYLLSASGTTATLPSVQDGLSYKFVVNGALTTQNYVIDSSEGDNIEGTLIVAGAVVDCAAEDQINIVVDGENVGDYVELYSDGTQWLIRDSGALTTAKMTCTDPS